ncbi:MAG: integrase arm-type DNA-binding domain-containing protein [Paucimonas sp.]|jgi:predicted DNA-binding transcriptional regulator AlpA|nr:integrase arm-type DNA-binding domain-containing protein [Paucimonas sp.]
MGKLTVKRVEQLARAGEKEMANDGNGLYFKVGETGGPSWIYKYKLNKKTTEMGLGGYPRWKTIGRRAVGWDSLEIEQWVADQPDPKS